MVRNYTKNRISFQKKLIIVYIAKITLIYFLDIVHIPAILTYILSYFLYPLISALLKIHLLEYIWGYLKYMAWEEMQLQFTFQP